MQQRAYRKTKRLKTATSNIDPGISEEEYIQWINSHQNGRAWQYTLNNTTNKKGTFREGQAEYTKTKDMKAILAQDFSIIF
jgi:hypothetical protein